MAIVKKRVGKNEYVYLGSRKGSKIIHRYLGPVKDAKVAKIVEVFEEQKRVPERFHYLFWDVSAERINLRENASYVIERVLELGDLEALAWIERIYPSAKIIETLLMSRKIREKSRNFWKIWFGVECVSAANQTKASFFYDPYPLLAEKHYQDIPLAGIKDIAAMKLLAISQRGAKRDFVDLYFILQEVPFYKIAEGLIKRYGKHRINPVHVGKSLVYFFDAEPDPDPEYLEGYEVDWGVVKEFFKDHVKQFVLDLEKAKRDS